MDVINQTPSVVDCGLSSMDDPQAKYGFLTAKTTFRILDDGSTELETQEPLPIWKESVETELGLLPPDIAPRYDEAFEVILLGAAYGQGEREVEVRLSVGSVTRSIHVSGDRRWQGDTLAEPEPFERIPLSWSRAFGGSVVAQIDEHSAMDVSHNLNPRGRGFDAAKLAEDIGKGFQCPAGYPSIEYERMLPNLEHPDDRVRTPADEPRPYCWATIHTDSGMHLIRQMDHMEQTGRTLAEADAVRMVHHRAHPDWILELPGPGARVELLGATPGGRLAFTLPQLRVLADYELGDRTGTRELAPQVLVLLPEERRCYLVHRNGFSVQTTPDMARSFRIRHQEGWFQYPEERTA